MQNDIITVINQEDIFYNINDLSIIRFLKDGCFLVVDKLRSYV